MRTVCIIPAFNEEKTIKDVLEVVKNVEIIDEIVVVSDGSDDNTAKVARDMGVFTIEYEENRGKGAALKAGIESTNADVLLFLDADLIGLREEHVESLLEPVLNDEADMSIGIFSNGRLATDLAQKVAPHLSGQRAMRRQVVNNINNIDITRYGVEVALTKLVEKQNYRVKTVELKDLTHMMKEEKLGLKKGIAARMKMYWEIVKCLKM